MRERVEKKYLEDYAWFTHRVRRSIPPPRELEEEVAKVSWVRWNRIVAIKVKF